MLRTAGFLRLLAATAYAFCCRRSDAAGAKRERWEERAERCRRYGETVADQQTEGRGR